jgi:hypothetical protein
MIPLGLASTLLIDVGSAISSGLSKLSGTSSASDSGQPSFAAHLHAATSQNGAFAGNRAEGSHLHHMHGVTNASSHLSNAATGSGTAKGHAIGSHIDIKV